MAHLPGLAAGELLAELGDGADCRLLSEGCSIVHILGQKGRMGVHTRDLQAGGKDIFHWCCRVSMQGDFGMYLWYTISVSIYLMDRVPRRF